LISPNCQPLAFDVSGNAGRRDGGPGLNLKKMRCFKVLAQVSGPANHAFRLLTPWDSGVFAVLY
jgi:hypothetical protein